MQWVGAALGAGEESLVWDTTCSELIVSPGFSVKVSGMGG